MTDQQRSIRTTVDDKSIPENNSINILDDQFRNSMEILIAEYIGAIVKNYFTEYQRLAVYTFYPPLNPKQLRILAIDNVTSNEIKRQISEKVYKQLEIIWEQKIINWNSVVQTTAKRFVNNAVEDAIDLIREKLLGNMDNEEQTSNIIVQRFVLLNNRLKMVYYLHDRNLSVYDRIVDVIVL